MWKHNNYSVYMYICLYVHIYLIFQNKYIIHLIQQMYAESFYDPDIVLDTEDAVKMRR